MPGESRHRCGACMLSNRRRRTVKRRKMPGPGSETKRAYGESGVLTFRIHG